MKHRRVLPFSPLALLFALAPALRAEIVTDGTVGPQQALSGPDFVVPETLGARAGVNLFHSFDRFSIHQGESATFTGSAEIQNVISRVTGSDPSTIDGTLRSEVGQADFYLLNPRGVLFGPDAQVDVPAGFHVGTGSEIVFPDGEVYSAVDPNASTLSVEAPDGFGFDGAVAGEITIDGSELRFAEGSAVTLAGGDLEITGDDQDVITAPAGQLRLIAQGNQAGTVSVHGDLPEMAMGHLEVTDTDIEVSGDGGGLVTIRAGMAVFNDGDFNARNTGEADNGATGNNGALDIRVMGLLELVDGASINGST